MTYDFPFWAIEGEVIPEDANFKEEGLVTPEGWEGEKGKSKICWSMGGIEPRSHHSKIQKDGWDKDILNLGFKWC